MDKNKKTMSDIAVKLDNISKFYKLYNSPKDRLKEALHPFKKKLHKKFYALQNINLEIKKGEILGIVGKNGSGKSTLLKLICEILQPSSGKVVVNGAVSALLDLSVGLNPEFTGIQNIYFSGTMMGFSRKEMEKKIDDIVDFAEIGDFIHQPLKTYSSGMRARLGFALAINMEPEILVLDEVLSVGDELFRRKCHARMEEFFKSNCTVLYVSHSVNTINQICTRAVFLDQGEQILEGPPKFVTNYYQKFLFAKPGSRKNVRNEIVQLNKSEEKKKDFSRNEEKVKEKIEDKEDKRAGSRKIENMESRQISYFLENFNPKSTVVQKSYPVDITDIEIKTLDGKRVNVLVIDESYIYSYKVHFNTDMERIFFTMAIGSMQGVNISSAKTLDKDIIERVRKGSTYLVKWKFQCRLLPGTYYTNVCVYTVSPKHEDVVLNRIVDAIAFKVQKNFELRYTGMVHLSQDFQVELLK